MDDLPADILNLIFTKVPIAIWKSQNSSDQISYLNHLEPCARCDHGGINCTHLHPDEQMGIKQLILVCQRWKKVIRDKYRKKFSQFVPECL